MGNAVTKRIGERVCHSLWQWSSFAEQYWTTLPYRSELGCFGTGYNAWGVQTNQKYLGAMAILASGEAGPGEDGITERLAAERFLRALRFSFTTHCTGDETCTDGSKWGRTWISVLGLERMMHGVERMEPLLSDEDRMALRRVLIDEADHQLAGPVEADPWGRSGKNRPDANLWNAAACARAALYYPEHAHVDLWRERAHLLFLNGISVPADAESETVYAGQPLRAWHVGANFFPHYALDRHGYLNAGYMVICLSLIASLHYAYQRRGVEAPEALYHHAEDLWALVRRLIFPDGRLLHVGGDTRIRYSGGQDYLLPTLFFAADYWGDPHAVELLDGAVELIAREQFDNGDGSFLSKRLSEMRRHSPYYYTRVESEKAVALSQVLHWLQRRELKPRSTSATFESMVAGDWSATEHGAALHRSPTRMVSWCWRAADPPQGLCVPPERSDMAEWRENMGGTLHLFGSQGERTCKHWHLNAFEGGFVTAGEMVDGRRVELAEGWHVGFPARHFIAFAALPDEHTVLRVERVTLGAGRTYVDGYEGVKLEIPNDFFNGRRRRYAGSKGDLVLEAHEGAVVRQSLGTPWLNVDGCLGLVGVLGANSWSILRRGVRTGGNAFGSILTDTLCFGQVAESSARFGPCVLFENAVVCLSSATVSETRRYHEGVRARRIACNHENCMALKARGWDDRRYLLVVNFGDRSVDVKVNVKGSWCDLAAERELSDTDETWSLSPLDPLLLRERTD